MKTITFRVSDEEALRLATKAREAGVSVSEFIRSETIGPRGGKVARAICPATGALIFKGIEGDPPLTTERVKQMLEDFP